jgi:hypothetical protein
MDAFDQVFAALVVHHETHSTQLHAVHRLGESGVAMQGLQHEAVAAQATSTSASRRVFAVARDHCASARCASSEGLARKARRGVAVIGGSVAMRGG